MRLARDKNTGEEVAVKCLCTADHGNTDAALKNEVAVMRRLGRQLGRHPNVLSLHGVFKVPGKGGASLTSV